MYSRFDPVELIKGLLLYRFEFFGCIRLAELRLLKGRMNAAVGYYAGGAALAGMTILLFKLE